MSDTDDKQEPSVAVEQEIPTMALVTSGKISRTDLTRRRKDYAIAQFRESVSKSEVARQLGIGRDAIYDWIEHDKDFRDRILRMRSLLALGLIPKAMKTLEDSMDAMDGETRRKAANDILDHAEGRRTREAGITINADKMVFNNLSAGDLMGLLKGMGLDLKDEPVVKEAGEPAPLEIPAPEAESVPAAALPEPAVAYEVGEDAEEIQDPPDPPPNPESLPPVLLPAVPPADPAPNPEKLDPPEEAKDGE